MISITFDSQEELSNFLERKYISNIDGSIFIKKDKLKELIRKFGGISVNNDYLLLFVQELTGLSWDNFL